MNKKLGICQSRGLGDIVIAIPIAKYYHDQGHEILWPICEEFLNSFKDTVPWIKWIPVPTDEKGQFFYDEPMKRLKNLGCDNIMILYQALNIHPELSDVPWFQVQKFDEFKYTKAGVPFRFKWWLEECITRNPQREQALFDKLNPENKPFYLTHLDGSSFQATPDLSNVPEDWLHIKMEPLTDCVFDWLTLMERAEALILIDSIFANLADQLDIEVDKYWIPRSHIHLTPVLGSQWTILDPPSESLAAKKIFGLSRS